jgi:hypothetical protein
MSVLLAKTIRRRLVSSKYSHQEAINIGISRRAAAFMAKAVAWNKQERLMPSPVSTG